MLRLTGGHRSRLLARVNSPECALTGSDYEPAPSNSSFVVTITEGALRFTSGVLPGNSYKIHTPVATIGIRGTIRDLVVDRETRNDGTVHTIVSLSIVEGEADLINCEGELTRVTTGLSGRVMGSSTDCFEASELGSQPAELSVIVKARACGASSTRPLGLPLHDKISTENAL